MDFFLGALWVVIGLVTLLMGYRMFRLLLPMLGFIAGFFIGAQVVALALNEGFLASILGILVGLGAGLLGAYIAYAWWWLGVILAFAATGYAVGYGLLPLIGVDLDLVNVLIGIIFGVAVALIAAAFRLPRVLVIFWTSVWGAAAVVVGVLVVLGRMTVDDLGYGGIDQFVRFEWFWLAAWAALAAVGMVVQLGTSDEYDLAPAPDGTLTGAPAKPRPYDHRATGTWSGPPTGDDEADR